MIKLLYKKYCEKITFRFVFYLAFLAEWDFHFL